MELDLDGNCVGYYRLETPQYSLGQEVIVQDPKGRKHRRTHLARWSLFRILQAANTAGLTWLDSNCLGSYRPKTPQDSLGQVVIVQDPIGWKHCRIHLVRWSLYRTLQAVNATGLTWLDSNCIGSYRPKTPQDSLGQLGIVEDPICRKHRRTHLVRWSLFSILQAENTAGLTW